MNPPSNHRRDSEAADALAALAQTGLRRNSTNNHESLPSFSPTVVHKSLPSAMNAEASVKRESSQDVVSPALPTLSVLLGGDRETKSAVETGAPPSIPLFMPAQVDRKPDRNENKSSKSSKTAEANTSSSPAPLRGVEDDLERDLLEAAANEHGLRVARKSPEAIPSAAISSIPKKRAAPKTAANQKRGTAKKSSSSIKRRKIELDTPTPSDTRSNTPMSRSGRIDIKSRVSVTPGPDDSSAAADESEIYEEDEDEEDGVSNDGEELFCICRKPDDHKYMIACDAGCDDWFHGKCVKISEDDGKLIDRYICPNCEAKGKGETTWKPMCRRQSCRKPARLTGTDISKYCSNDCGLRFFSELISRYPDDVKSKTRKKSNKITTQELPDPRAGPLDPFQLKALVDAAADSKTFRSLGNGVLQPTSPGLSKSFGALTFPTDNQLPKSVSLISSEQAELERITTQKHNLRDARALLEDRKRYFSFAKDRLAAYLDRSGIKPKDLCGFDPRLAWSPQRFQRWRTSPAGIAVFERGALEPYHNPAANGVASEDTKAHVNGTTTAPPDDDDGGGAGGADDAASPAVLCARKRCERHKMWQRLQVEEARFDESRLADEMRRLDRLERELRERAALRARRLTSGLLARQGHVVAAAAAAAATAAAPADGARERGGDVVVNGAASATVV